MIVYAESNLVVELALGQEEATAADELLNLAQQGRLSLVLPTFSLSEPFATLTQRERGRASLRNRLVDELQQLSRSEPHREVAVALEPLALRVY